jgi:hypothetical protein
MAVVFTGAVARSALDAALAATGWAAKVTSAPASAACVAVEVTSPATRSARHIAFRVSEGVDVVAEPGGTSTAPLLSGATTRTTFSHDLSPPFNDDND